MASILATQTIVGTIGNVYELRTVGRENRKVIDFSVAVTRKKKEGDEWKDRDTYWVNVTAWGTLAENIEKSFKQGDRVIVVGYTDMKPGYTTENGDERPAKPIVVAEFAGHDLTYAHSTLHREERGARQKQAQAPARKAAPAKKAAPKVVEDDTNFDDLDDFSFDDSDDAPPF